MVNASSSLNGLMDPSHGNQPQTLMRPDRRLQQ
jgi:hypothetical protein